jgi:hypothetical protein
MSKYHGYVSPDEIDRELDKFGATARDPISMNVYALSKIANAGYRIFDGVFSILDCMDGGKKKKKKKKYNRSYW